MKKNEDYNKEYDINTLIHLPYQFLKIFFEFLNKNGIY